MDRRLFLIYSILLGIIILLFSRCNLSNDNYYLNKNEFGLSRIPTVPPCFVGSTTGIKGPWIMTDCCNKGCGHKLQSMDILDSIIVSLDYDEWIPIEKRDTIWYIDAPLLSVNSSFSSYDSFVEVLEKYTLKVPSFISCKDLKIEYDQKGYLKWFPEKYKE